MLLQEELTRNLVSMTSQALYTTMTMANSCVFWISSLTPAVSEGLSKAGAFVFGTPIVFGADETGERGATAEAGSASHYYNAIHTMILLFTIWIYLKTIRLVCRSVSAVWETTVGVWKVLGFCASKIGRLVHCWALYRLLFHRQAPPNEEEDVSTNDTAGSQTLDPPVAPAAAPAMPQANTTAHGHSINSFQQQEQGFRQSHGSLGPPLPPQGAGWYYYNPVTPMPWLPPPSSTLPPFAPFPVGAPLAHHHQHHPGLPPPQDSFFVPISGPPIEGTTDRNNSKENSHNATNSTDDPRMANAQNALSPQRGSPSGKSGDDNGEKTLHVTASDKSDRAMVESIGNGTNDLSSVDPATATAAGNATAPAAATAEALANLANPKKRKSPPEESPSPSNAEIESKETLTMNSNETSATAGSPSKKQRREKAKANARAWAEHAFGSTTD